MIPRLTRAFVVGVLVGLGLCVNLQAAVPGSKVTVTFEGLVRGHHEAPIEAGYDGLNWSGTIYSAAKGCFRHDPGFQAVIHGRVAGVIQQGGSSGFFTPVSGLMSVKSGHFAAFAGSPFGVTFNAYRDNVLVGSMQVPELAAVDTPIQFDRTFSNIDKFEIIGEVAFDNIVVRF